MRFLTEAELEELRQTPEHKAYKRQLARYMFGLASSSFVLGLATAFLFKSFI